MNSISKTIKRSLAFALSFVMVVSVLTTVPATTTEAAAKKIVKSVAVSKSKTTITAGKSTTLKAKVTATKKVAASDLKVTVKSSKKSIATVKITKNPAKKAKSGYTYFKVTGKKAGKATITVTAKNKSKKGKTVKKSIAVTVKAVPTTQAPTTQAPTTEDPTVLKGIVVTPATLDMVEKGTDKITVAADPATATLPTPVFASKNPAVATVTADGTVTAVSAGNAEITITVGEFTKSVTVTVKAAVDGKLTLDPKQLNIFVGETKVVKAQKEGEAIKDMEIVWTSSDEKVATVDKDGNVKAIAKGNAVITATVGNTSVLDTCNVEVRDDAPGIATFKATAANVLTATLSHDVNKDDQAKVKFELKMGQDAQTVEVTWVDAHTITFKKATDYKAGKYTLTMSAEGLTLNSSATTATADVVANKASKIVVDTSTISAGVKAGSFKYQVLDIYEQPMKVTNPGIVKWTVTSTNTLNSVSILDGNGNVTATGDTVSFTCSRELTADEKIRVNAYLVADMAVNTGLVEIPVAPLYIDSLVFTGVVNEKGEKVEMAYSTQNKDYYLTYEAVDNFGKPVDVKTYHYSNLEQFATTLTSSDTSIMSNPRFETKGVAPNETLTGRIVATVNAGKSGSVTVQAMGYNYKPTSYVFKINEEAVPSTIEIGDGKDYDVVAGETVSIPVKFKDQYGKDASVANDTAFKKYFSANIYDVQGGNIVTSITTKTVTYADGKLTFSTAGCTKEGSINLVVTKANDITKSVTYTIPVKAGRTPSQVLLKDGDMFTSVLTGQTKNIKFTVCDDYDTICDGNGSHVATTGYKLFASTPATSGIGLVGATTANGVATANLGLVAGKATLTVTGGAAATTADAEITLELKKDGATTPVWTKTYKVAVTNELDAIKVTANAAEYKSGEDVILTFKAMNSGNVISNYNQSIDVVIAEVSEGVTTKYSRTLNFVNGEAKATVQAKTAVTGNNKAYYAIVENIDLPSTNAPSGLDISGWKTGDVVVKTNVASKLAVSVSGTTLVIVAQDLNGNTVKDYTPASKLVNIKFNDKDTATSKNVFEGLLDTDSNMIKKANFNNGVAYVTINDVSGGSGSGFTVTISGISGTKTY